jgi:hypothetical protein
MTGPLAAEEKEGAQADDEGQEQQVGLEPITLHQRHLGSRPRGSLPGSIGL